MKQAEEDRVFAQTHNNAMAAHKSTELLCRLSGFLVEVIHLKMEKHDLKGALEEARHRVIDITPRPRPVSATEVLTELQSPIREHAVCVEADGSSAWKPLMD